MSLDARDATNPPDIGPEASPVPVEPELEKPPAVEEAEDRIRTWGTWLASAGMVGSAVYWFLAARAGLLYVPMSWWGVFLVGLVAAFFFPPTRGARRAREVLRRWDDLRVEAALEAGGAPTGPEQRVASEMAGRILHHPDADPAVKDVTRRLLKGLRQAGRDRRTVELVRRARAAGLMGEGRERSWSDLLDFVSAREGELLSSLEHLHRAVVLREAGELAHVRGEAENVLARLEAEAEVDRMLGGGESGA